MKEEAYLFPSSFILILKYNKNINIRRHFFVNYIENLNKYR